MNLNEISNCLLESEGHAECLRASIELHSLFSGIVKLSENPWSEDQRDSLLSEGKALSPGAASHCIFDYMRTRSFLRGVRLAVNQALQRFPGQTIHILYAGCGPFAPLVLPLTTQYPSEKVQFTLLDIHSRSLDAVRQIVETLGLAAYVRDYIQCDAASHHPPRLTEPHIIVIETMQKALEKEPQVAVVRNLLPLIKKGGFLVPEKIKLTACLGDASKEVDSTWADSADMRNYNNRRARLDLGTVFELNADSAGQSWNQCPDQAYALCSSPVTIRVPEITNGMRDLMVLTNITVFDSIVLRDYESGLTYPTVLTEPALLNGNIQLEVRYVTGECPGLRWRSLECGDSAFLECGDSSPLSTVSIR